MYFLRKLGGDFFLAIMITFFAIAFSEYSYVLLVFSEDRNSTSKAIDKPLAQNHMICGVCNVGVGAYRATVNFYLIEVGNKQFYVWRKYLTDVKHVITSEPSLNVSDASVTCFEQQYYCSIEITVRFTENIKHRTVRSPVGCLAYYCLVAFIL